MPQPLQLPGSDVSSTHAVGAAVGHALKPVLHVKVHLLLAQVGCAFCTSFGHPSPHPLQSLALLVVSTQAPLQSVGVPTGHPVTQVPPAQTGSLVVHALVHEPHAAGFVMSVSQPSSGVPSQSDQPFAHAEGGKLHCPDEVHVVVPETCARFVQSWPHTPQLCTSLGTHAPLQSRSPGAHPVGPASAAPVSAASPASPPPVVPVSGAAPVSAVAVASW
jgi:hypothetical protein